MIPLLWQNNYVYFSVIFAGPYPSIHKHIIYKEAYSGWISFSFLLYFNDIKPVRILNSQMNCMLVKNYSYPLSSFQGAGATGSVLSPSDSLAGKLSGCFASHCFPAKRVVEGQKLMDRL